MSYYQSLYCDFVLHPDIETDHVLSSISIHVYTNLLTRDYQSTKCILYAESSWSPSSFELAKAPFCHAMHGSPHFRSYAATLALRNIQTFQDIHLRV